MGFSTSTLTIRLVLASLLAFIASCSNLPVGGALPASFSRALERTMPSIVGIYGLEAESERIGDLSLTDGTVGAGFFLDGHGTLVTAAHVTADHETIVVRLADQRIYLAERVVEDRELDIAVIRIPLTDSVPAPIGPASALRPGDWVLAVGEPFGLRRSVLAGVVGGAMRHFADDAEGMYIQTNMALNPGNSGGPLLNLQGAVVGMNVRTVIGSQGTGVSLSIPIDVILQIRRELEQGIERPRFGARFEDVSPPVAHLAGLSTTRGASICEVIESGVAEQAGLRVGDIVVRMDGAEIIDSADLSRRLFAWREPGNATFTVVRGKQARTIKLP